MVNSEKTPALVNSEPLVVRAGNQAFRMSVIDEVIVPTDDDEILKLLEGSRCS